MYVCMYVCMYVSMYICTRWATKKNIQYASKAWNLFDLYDNILQSV